jgi:perosamine synthetase
MIDLLPVELWNYRLIDIIRGLSATMDPIDSQQVLHINGLGNCIPTKSARAALIIAIEALDLKPGARIGVPLYCCPAVFKSIKASGCVPIYIDIDPSTFCISIDDLSAKCLHLDCLIAVHMFGNLCNMAKIKEIMNGKPIIEDCAQSLGSRIDGQLAGSFGSIGAFSFNSGKYLSVGLGGALFSSDSEINSRITQISISKSSSSLAQEFLYIFKTYIRSKLRSKPLYGLVGSRLWNLYNKKVDFAKKTPIVQGQIFSSALALVRNRLNYLDSMIEGHRKHADYYTRHLQLDPSMLCLEKPGTYYNRLYYPITFPSQEHRNFIVSYLKSRLIAVSTPYGEVIEGAAKHYGYKGDCPISEQNLRRTIVIPSHFQIKKREIVQITQSINKGWKQIGS